MTGGCDGSTSACMGAGGGGGWSIAIWGRGMTS